MLEHVSPYQTTGVNRNVLDGPPRYSAVSTRDRGRACDVGIMRGMR